MIGNPPIGKSCDTTALLVPSEDPAFKPLVDLLKVNFSLGICVFHNFIFTFKEQEKKDGVTTTGKPIVEPRQNKDGEKCQKCDNVGEEVWVCSVIIHSSHMLT